MRRLLIFAAAALVHRVAGRRRRHPRPGQGDRRLPHRLPRRRPALFLPGRARAAGRLYRRSVPGGRRRARPRACAPTTCWCMPASASSRCTTARSTSCATPARSPLRAARSSTSRFPTYLDGAGVLSRTERAGAAFRGSRRQARRRIDRHHHRAAAAPFAQGARAQRHGGAGAATTATAWNWCRTPSSTPISPTVGPHPIGWWRRRASRAASPATDSGRPGLRPS